MRSGFVSRWDKATLHRLPGDHGDRLGVAVSRQSSGACRDLLDLGQGQWLEGQGARPLRLLFTGTGNNDPQALEVLPTPGTICCMRPTQRAGHCAIRHEGAAYARIASAE